MTVDQRRGVTGGPVTDGVDEVAADLCAHNGEAPVVETGDEARALVLDPAEATPA